MPPSVRVWLPETPHATTDYIEIDHVPDFSRHSTDYARFRTGPPAAFYDRLAARRPIEGMQAVDLGTGTGFVAIELAKRGACVVGVDVAAPQIEQAVQAAARAGVDRQCAFMVAPAESTGLESGQYDLAISCCAFHWFQRLTVLDEVARLLRPGGILAVVYDSYLTRHSAVAQRTEDLLLALNPRWSMAAHTGTFAQDIDDLCTPGLTFVEQFCFDHDVRFSHEAWRGRMRTCNGVGSGGMDSLEVEAFDRQLDRLLHKEFPEEPLRVRHRLWATLFTRVDEDNV